MAYRDRLAASRAQRQQQPVELDTLQSPSYPTGGSASAPQAGGTTDTPSFLAEDASIHQGIQRLRDNVSRLGALRLQSINAIDENNTTHEHIETLTNETRDLTQELKKRIEYLNSLRVQDKQLRKNRLSLLRSKFVEALQEFQREEQDGRQRTRQRVERQLKIVKPDATPQQVAEAIEGGGGDQIFAQALSSSTRYKESRSAYLEVQERHQELLRLEQTLTELAQLFQDMSAMVEQDNEKINDINNTAERVAGDTGAGLKQTEIAVVHARNYRKWRWWCFGITLFVVVVVALAVGLYFGVGPGKPKTS